MDLDLALRTKRPILAEDNSNEAKVERWDSSNRMSLMIMKRFIPEATNAKESLEAIQQYFAKNEKAKRSNHLTDLISMRYNGKENIREYIMEMSNLAGKLKALKLEITYDFLVHLVLLSLPRQFTQFKCVQEEDRIQRDKIESAHFTSNSQNNRKNKAKDATWKQLQKKVKKDDEFTCFFYKKVGYMKKDYPKYAAWRVGCYLDLVDTFVSPTFKLNSISTFSLDKNGYFFGFGNGKFSISLGSNVFGNGLKCYCFP
ncbi:LOW QUALITY PROTEIN: hypothetical protein V2J09_017142 [Rumex salicifolius]